MRRLDASPRRNPVSLLRLVTSRRTSWVVVVLGLLAALAVIGAVGRAEQPVGPLTSAAEGYDSTEGTALQQELPEAEGSVAVVLATADEGELDRSQLGGVQRAVQQATEGTDLKPAGPPVLRAEDGTATLSVLRTPELGAEKNADLVKDLRADLDDAAPEGVTLQVTGPAAVEADLASVFDGATFTLLAVTGSVVALLLLITYRSPILWLVPLTVVGIADQLAAVLATRFLAAIDVPWDEIGRASGRGSLQVDG